MWISLPAVLDMIQQHICSAIFTAEFMAVRIYSNPFAAGRDFVSVNGIMSLQNLKCLITCLSSC